LFSLFFVSSILFNAVSKYSGDSFETVVFSFHTSAVAFLAASAFFASSPLSIPLTYLFSSHKVYVHSFQSASLGPDPSFNQSIP
jgi:hypothetical protein